MEEDLSSILDDREVDLRTPEDLSRYFRDEVLGNSEEIYAQRWSQSVETYVGNEIREFSEGKTRSDLDEDRKLSLSLVHIDLDIVWKTVNDDIPPLVSKLEKIIDDEG